MAKIGIIDQAVKAIEGKNLTIVFPEGKDERVLEAAIRHQENGLITPIVLGDQGEVQKAADKLGKSISHIKILNPETFEDFDKLVDSFAEVRKGKIDLDKKLLYYKEKEVEVTALEYEIILLFIKNPHRVYTRSQLLEMFWEDRDKFVRDNTLTSTIKRIREKLDKSIITTVRGKSFHLL